MAAIRERVNKDGSIRYTVQIRLKGHPPEVATFSSKTDAKRWAQQTEAAIREGRCFKTAEAKGRTFAEMIDRYVRTVLPAKGENSQHSQKHQLMWWKEQLGQYTLANLTPALIAQQRDVLAKGITRRGRQRSPSTVNRYLAALSHCYGIAVREWRWVDDNPVREVTKLEEPRGRVRFLLDDERNRLLAECRKSGNECLYDVVVLALSTGMRHSEIMNLRWDDVDTRRGVAVLYDTKSGERRAVPLVGHALEILEERALNRREGSPYVFPGLYRPGEPPRSRQIRSAWDEAVKRAGIDDFRFHDLRHSAASCLAMNGASLAEIAHLLGHKTLQMVKRYAHLSEAHTKTVVERMNVQMFPSAFSSNTQHSQETSESDREQLSEAETENRAHQTNEPEDWRCW